MGECLHMACECFIRSHAKAEARAEKAEQERDEQRVLTVAAAQAQLEAEAERDEALGGNHYYEIAKALRKAIAERDNLQRTIDSWGVNGRQAMQDAVDELVADDECEHEWGNTILTTNPPQRRCTKCKHTEFIGGRR